MVPASPACELAVLWSEGGCVVEDVATGVIVP